MRELREDFSKTHSVEEARLKAEQTYREAEEALQTEVHGWCGVALLLHITLPSPLPLLLQMAASLEVKRKELQSQHKEELVRKQLQLIKQQYDGRN